MADKDHAETNEETTNDEENHDTGTQPSKNPNQRPKSKVCRKLDFDTDHEKEVRDLLSLSDADIEQHRRKGIEKWNFDFENEIPLEGDWQWERVPVEPPETRDVICVMEKQNHYNRTV